MDAAVAQKKQRQPMNLSEATGTSTPRDRRDVTRQRTHLAALAVSPDAQGEVHKTVICTVRDLSGGGAKVTIEDTDLIPKQLWLLISGHESVYECDVVWEQRQEFGLKFRASCPFSDLNAAGRQFLRSLSIAKPSRAAHG